MMPGEGKPFSEGTSGNPSGRPKGARNRTTLAMEALLEGEAEALTRKAIEMALEGDGPAMRLCMERLIPVRKDRRVEFDLPEINETTDLPKATAALLRAVAGGNITPGEASDIGNALAAHLKAIETSDLYERMRRIEEGGAV